ncbi:MAG: efflux RND transporter permease subunit [Pseudomonadota bacterium]
MLASILFKNSRYVVLMLMVIVLVGVASLREQGRQEDPSITNLHAKILTFFPGASPARVEALVAKPLEDAIREIAEVEELTSTSNTGVSLVFVELQESLDVSEIEAVWTEIRDALDDARQQMPAGVSKPQFDNDMTVPFVKILGLRPAPGVELPPGLLARVADDLADQSRNFPGTKLVELFGQPSEEVRVEIDERALVARGLHLDQVASALRSADARQSSGRVSGAANDMLVEVRGEFDSLERIRDVIVSTLPNGTAVRIADIARVYKTEVTPPNSVALVEGDRGVMIGVAMDDGLQVDRWSQDFGAFLDEYRANAPGGIVIDVTYDQSGYTIDRLQGVMTNMAIGISLVILVLLFSLGWRAAVVVAAILPLCTLMSITVMNFIGLPIHQMSVTGLIVALGLLVDGSIVMTDEIRKRLQRGEEAADAVRGSVRRMRMPLFASTVTTILAFMPMVLLPGPAGDFLGSIAKSVVIMLGASLLLALVLTPVLAAWLLPNGLNKSSHHWWDQGMEAGRAGTALSGALDWSLRHPWGSVALALVLPVAGFLAFPTLTAQFFPGTDRDQLYIQVKLPDGRSLQDTLAVARQMDTRLRGYDLVRRVDWMVGTSAPGFYYNMMRNKEGVASWAEAQVLTTDENQTDALIRTLQKEFDEVFPQARTVVRGIDQGPPVLAPLEIDLYGPNLDQLRALGQEFRLRMEKLADVTHSTTTLVAGAPKVVFELDEERVRLAQANLGDVSRTLDQSLRGITAGEVLEDTERLPVRARLAEADWSSVDQIANLRLPIPGTSNGDFPGVALNTLGDYELRPASSPITRKNGERVNTVQAFVQRGVLAEEALKVLVADLEANPITLPAGYRYSIGGEADDRAGVVQNIMAPFGLVMAMLIATVVITFNSWRLSAIAFFVCLCSMGLSLLALAVFRYPFGVQALIGVIGSIGVSVNAAIIIMTALQLDDDARRGHLEAMRNVVMDSSRHIVSTTVTTFGGFLPLILEGSQFWPPFAMAIAGGVLLSTVVSFFLVPQLFLLVNSKRGGAAIKQFMLESPSNNKLDRIAS